MLGVTCRYTHFLYSCLPSLVRCASDLVLSYLVLTQSFQLGGTSMTIHTETGTGNNAYKFY